MAEEIKLSPETEALVKTILNSYRGDPYSRQKLITDYIKENTPKEEVKKIYSQNWTIYYRACKNEKLMFFRILKDAVDYLDIPDHPCGVGRNPVKIADIVKSICIWQYSGLSSWRVDSELRIAQSLGIIDNVYKKTSLNKYLGRPEITKWLHKLYQVIAQPIAQIEERLSIDATGISVAYGRKRWVEIRTDYRQHKDYKKLHIVIGTLTNIVFAAEITKGTDHESPLLPSLVDIATRYTSAREMSADAGYLSKKNADYISSKGMIPYIMPKKNVRSLNRGSSGAWGSMIRLWKEYPDLFKLHYHQRSNSEASIGMIKRKLGYYTRAKNHTAQVNDILARIVCLNAAILAEAMLEFNLSPVFTDG